MHFNRIFSNCLSQNSLVKECPYRFRSRGTTTLPHWTMIFTICVEADESECLYIPILEFLTIVEYLSFFLNMKQILHQLLVLRFLTIWIWYPWLLLLSFGILMNLILRILHKLQIFHNVVSEYNSTFVFLVFHLQFDILQMIDIHPYGKMNFCVFHPYFIDHFFLTSNFRLLPRRNLFQFSLIFMHCCFAAGIFMTWIIGINLWNKL